MCEYGRVCMLMNVGCVVKGAIVWMRPGNGWHWVRIRLTPGYGAGKMLKKESRLANIVCT